MANNPITDEQLAELDRLHAETGTSCDKWLKACMATFNAYPALRQRLLAAESRLAEVERERDELRAIVASPEYRQMLADQAGRYDRDAQQRREGAAEVWDIVAERSMMVGDLSGEMYAKAQAKRLRDGGE